MSVARKFSFRLKMENKNQYYSEMKHLYFVILSFLLSACASSNSKSDSSSFANRENIRQVFRSHLPEIKSCYDTELKNVNGDLEGKVVLEIEVNDQGNADKVTAQSTTLNNSNVENCMIQIFKQTKYPPAPKDKTVVIQYPFIFGKNPSQ
jgi:PBP1b-binding outer membrane lipoprotein LpoB